MKKTTLLDGIIVAMIIAFCAGIASLILSGFITKGTLFTLLLSGSTLVYLIYLFRHSEARIGRVVVISIWAAISLATWLIAISLLEQVLIYTGLIWLLRSLYFHHSLFAALLDLGLILTGLVASTWAIVNTGHGAIALWTFFLVQSLFALIPHIIPHLGLSPPNKPLDASSSFQLSHRIAHEAVRKLSNKCPQANTRR